MSLIRSASALVLGAALSIGAVGHSSVAVAADMPVKAKPVPVATPWVLDVHGYADLTFASTRVTGGGLLLYDHGYLTQLDTGLALDVYKDPNGFINSFTVFGGTWNEFWDSPPASSRSWQEMDWWVGATVGFAKYWSLTVQHVQFNFPIPSPPPTAYNYDLKLGFNDASFGLPVTFSPFVEVFYNAAGGSTVVFGKTDSTYRVTFGASPTINLAKATGIPLTLVVPTWVVIGPSDFWNRNDGTTSVCGSTGTAPCSLSNFGYVSTGLRGLLALDSVVPKRLGNWYVKGGFQYYHINNDALLAAQVAVGSASAFTAAQRDVVVGYGGLGFSF